MYNLLHSRASVKPFYIYSDVWLMAFPWNTLPAYTNAYYTDCDAPS